MDARSLPPTSHSPSFVNRTVETEGLRQDPELGPQTVSIRPAFWTRCQAMPKTVKRNPFPADQHVPEGHWPMCLVLTELAMLLVRIARE